MRPGVINWLIEKSSLEVLEDGTVSRFFHGTLPADMMAELLDTAEMMGATYRGTNKQTTYSWQDGDLSYAFSKGVYHSTSRTIHFSFNDYTAPANAARAETQTAMNELMAFIF